MCAPCSFIYCNPLRLTGLSATACTTVRGMQQGYGAHVTIGEIEAEIRQAGVHTAAVKSTGRLLWGCSTSSCKRCSWITQNHLLRSSQLQFRLLKKKSPVSTAGTLWGPKPSMCVFTAGTSPKRPFTGTFMGAWPRPSSRVGTSPPLVPSQRDVTRDCTIWRIFQLEFRTRWVGTVMLMLVS